MRVSSCELLIRTLLITSIALALSPACTKQDSFRSDLEKRTEQWREEAHVVEIAFEGVQLRSRLDFLAFEYAMWVIEQTHIPEQDNNRAFIENPDNYEKVFDYALGRYYAVMFNEPLLVNIPTGEFNYQEQDARKALLESDPIITIVGLENIISHVHKQEPPAYRDLREAREFLRAYGEIGDRFVARRAGIVEKRLGNGKPSGLTLATLYEEWKKKSGFQKALYEREHPLLRAALSSGDMSRPGIAELKVLWRQQKDPQYERLLYKYGYVSTWKHPEN